MGTSRSARSSTLSAESIVIAVARNRRAACRVRGRTSTTHRPGGQCYARLSTAPAKPIPSRQPQSPAIAVTARLNVRVAARRAAGQPRPGSVGSEVDPRGQPAARAAYGHVDWLITRTPSRPLYRPYTGASAPDSQIASSRQAGRTSARSRFQAMVRCRARTHRVSRARKYCRPREWCGGSSGRRERLRRHRDATGGVGKTSLSSHARSESDAGGQ